MKILKKIQSFFFNFIVKMKVVCYIKLLRVNGLSFVSRNTKLGKNVNFNGIRITGCGKVSIGDNFHSGKNCLIISENHNFNQGKKYPMMKHTYVKKLK